MSKRKDVTALGRWCSMGCAAVFALLFYAIIVAFWIGIDAGYRHDLALLDHGEEVTATVTDVRESYRHHRHRWYTDYEYQVNSGTYRDNFRDTGSAPTYVTGDTIALIYDPDEPSYARVASHITREHIERWRTISTIAMAVFTLLAVTSTALGIRRIMKRRWLSLRLHT